MSQPLAMLVDLGLRLFEELSASPALIRWAARRIPLVLSRPTPVGGTTRALQQIRLHQTVRHVYHHSPFYRRMFDRLGLHPSDIKTLEDLQKLPFTAPADLYEWRDFLCLPLEQMAAVFTTSGTTGEPKRVYFTRRDLNVLTNFAAVVLRLSFPGRLVGFLALPAGSGLWVGPGTSQRFIERAGGLALPFGSGDPRTLLQWMRRLSPTCSFLRPLT